MELGRAISLASHQSISVPPALEFCTHQGRGVLCLLLSALRGACTLAHGVGRNIPHSVEKLLLGPTPPLPAWYLLV